MTHDELSALIHEEAAKVGMKVESVKLEARGAKGKWWGAYVRSPGQERALLRSYELPPTPERVAGLFRGYGGRGEGEGGE